MNIRTHLFNTLMKARLLLVDFENLVLRPDYTPRFLKKGYFFLKDYILGFFSDKDTCFIISYPKSGATWLQYMIIQIFSERKEETVLLDEFAKKFDLDLRWSHDQAAMHSEKGFLPNPHELYINDKRNRYRNCKVILLVRDPRDVVVSVFHQVTKRSKRPLKFDSVSDLIKSKIFGFPRIIRFFDVWRKNLKTPRKILIISYEQLLTEGVDTMKRVVRFISDKKVSDSLIKEVYDESNAASMRKKEQEGKIKGMALYGKDKAALKVRKAKIGSYKEELKKEDISYCNRMIKKRKKVFNDYF